MPDLDVDGSITLQIRLSPRDHKALRTIAIATGTTIDEIIEKIVHEAMHVQFSTPEGIDLYIKQIKAQLLEAAGADVS